MRWKVTTRSGFYAGTDANVYPLLDHNPMSFREMTIKLICESGNKIDIVRRDKAPRLELKSEKGDQ